MELNSLKRKLAYYSRPSSTPTTADVDREMCEHFNAKVQTPVDLTDKVSYWSDQALSYDVKMAEQLWVKMNGKLCKINEETELDSLMAALDEHIVDYNHYPLTSNDWRIKVN